MLSWLRFFRVVNLPTVPGDVLVGAAIGIVSSSHEDVRSIVAACIASVFLYLFGLADNDIIGASADKGRPIADGEISLRAAKLARGLCLLGALVAGAVICLPPAWWCSALVLTAAIAVYNRTKRSLLMGACRGLNVACGGFAVAPADGFNGFFSILLPLAAVCWTLYVAGVTAYSAGEEADPAKRRRVGFLIGALVYLQILALAALHLFFGGLTSFVAAGAVLMLTLRFMKRLLPKVSAS